MADFVELKDCTRDVTAHLKCCNILTDVESVNNERKLLLTRAGIFIAQECQLHMTVCPKHRDAYGTRWRTGKTRCCVPAEVAGHKSTTCRGDRGIDRKQSCFVFKETGMLVPVGSPICRCRDHLGKMMVSTSTDSTETALSSPTVVVEPVSVQKRQETFLLVIVV
ncbi:hypothetical protein ABFA07_019293 [Porites harrisoni]